MHDRRGWPQTKNSTECGAHGQQWSERTQVRGGHSHADPAPGLGAFGIQHCSTMVSPATDG